jgi:hypothetical protein
MPPVGEVANTLNDAPRWIDYQLIKRETHYSERQSNLLAGHSNSSMPLCLPSTRFDVCAEELVQQPVT